MISKILTDIREQRNLTMKEVAEAIGMKPDTYRNYERGRLEPNLATIIKLADLYDVSADFLLGRDEVINMEIGKIMKKLRENRNLTMAEIAEKLEMPKGTYAAYEYGQNEPNLTVVRKLAIFYDVSADYLLDLPQKNNLSTLERLESEYNMSQLEKNIMEGYIQLTRDERDKVMEFIKENVEKSGE